MIESIFISERADGPGSHVIKLPGGDDLGEIADMEFFREKLLKALRIPANYMQKIKVEITVQD